MWKGLEPDRVFQLGRKANQGTLQSLWRRPHSPSLASGRPGAPACQRDSWAPRPRGVSQGRRSGTHRRPGAPDALAARRRAMQQLNFGAILAIRRRQSRRRPPWPCPPTCCHALGARAGSWPPGWRPPWIVSPTTSTSASAKSVSPMLHLDPTGLPDRAVRQERRDQSFVLKVGQLCTKVWSWDRCVAAGSLGSSIGRRPRAPLPGKTHGRFRIRP